MGAPGTVRRGMASASPCQEERTVPPEGGVMDIQHSQPPNLATRLRLAKIDDRVATLLATAVREELGLDLLDGRDAEAAARLGELIEIAARRSGPCAVNKFSLELMELLADAPDARDLLSRPRPELAPA